ncbi:MAG TPA: hypothetical protein VMG31_05140 [Verrucomicrobiae bacterium]|nr:hypothetical protein [Verrucomicrobiae bacterium]
MNNPLGKTFAVVCLLAMPALGARPASAQTQEVKEKPPMYTYVAFWEIPRQQWADEEKAVAAEQKLTEKGVADGQLVGYGDDKNLIHEVDGATHDTWFSAMSLAGIFNVLDGVYKSGMPTGPVQAGATRHWDNVFVSHYYNWHSGSWRDVYSAVANYKLKPDAPNDALDSLSKNLIVPVMEKLLADGTIHEYEIDTEAIHTNDPANFWIAYVAANAEALDKVQAAIRDAVRANPLSLPAFASMVDVSQHRDYLARTNATYK